MDLNQMTIQTTNLLANTSKTTSFTALVDRIDDPIDSGIAAYLEDECLRGIVHEEKLYPLLCDWDRLR